MTEEINTEELVEALDALYKQHNSVQTFFAFVLDAVGEKVTVNKDDILNNTLDGQQIIVHETEETFEFSIGPVDE